jgi:hypothetical protein
MAKQRNELELFTITIASIHTSYFSTCFSDEHFSKSRYQLVNLHDRPHCCRERMEDSFIEYLKSFPVKLELNSVSRIAVPSTGF